MNDPSWFESWFNSPYYHLLYRDRDESEARPFIERLTNHLQLPKQARILDLACGKGRHSISLADLGFEVHGIDIAPENIAHADRFSRPGLSFSVHDMRQSLSGEPFDVVLNLFTSFGYFESETEHQSALHTMSAALKTNGKLVIDYLNVNTVIKQLVKSESRTIDGVHFQIRRNVVAGYLIKEIIIDDPRRSKKLTFSEKVATFGLEDFKRLLQPERIGIGEVLGDYALAPFDPERSPRLILICEKN
jgi:2-polyprenyl-3-methyl-5-hydroxy-6-metoxy-1,4-benzoquinol methylase